MRAMRDGEQRKREEEREEERRAMRRRRKRGCDNGIDKPRGWEESVTTQVVLVVSLDGGSWVRNPLQLGGGLTVDDEVHRWGLEGTFPSC